MDAQKSQDPRRGLTSASAAEADGLCQGRHLAQRGLPEIPVSAEDSQWRDKGTLLHEAIHALGPDSVDAAPFPAFTPEDLSKIAELRELEAEAGQLWLHTIVKSDLPNPIEKFKREHRIWYRNELGQPIHSGQPDFVALARGEHALVLDFKTVQWGEHSHSAINGQLRDLAVMVSRYYQRSIVTVAIIQTGHRPQLVPYRSEDLRIAELQMLDRIALSNDPQSRRIPGEKQCRYCRAKLNCPEVYRQIVRVQELVREVDVEVLKTTVSNALVVELWAACKVAETVLGALHVVALKRLTADPKCLPPVGNCPGLELGEASLGDRKIPDVAKAHGAIEILSTAEFLKCCEVKITPLEDAVRAKLPRRQFKNGDEAIATKRAAKEYLEENLKELIVRSPKAPPIKSISPSVYALRAAQVDPASPAAIEVPTETIATE